MVVVVRRIEAQLGHKLRQLQVQPVELVDRHLPRLEARLLLLIDQPSNQQVFAQILLFGQTGGVDRSQPVQKGAIALEMSVVAGNRVVAELVVITLVAQCGGELRRVLQLLLPVVGEDGVQRLLALGNRR